MPKQFGWLVFFNTKKKITLDGVRTNDLPITSQTPYPLELREHLKNTCDKLVFYLCNKTCLPVGAPKCESRLWYPSQGFLQTGACPCVFLRSSDIVVESLFKSSSIIKHQASASSICHHINSTVSNFLLLYYCTCYCNELFIIFSNVLCLVSPVRLMSTKKGEY